jgi:hypothetical protein
LFGIQLFQKEVKDVGTSRAQNIHFIGFQEGVFLQGRKVDVEREAKSVMAGISRKCRSYVNGDPHPEIEHVLALMMDCAVYGCGGVEGDVSANDCDIQLQQATLDILTETVSTMIRFRACGVLIDSCRSKPDPHQPFRTCTSKWFHASPSEATK